MGLSASPALASPGRIRLMGAKKGIRTSHASPALRCRIPKRLAGAVPRASSDPYTIVSNDPEEVKREVGFLSATTTTRTSPTTPTHPQKITCSRMAFF